jgi:DHA1 family tetracycline resistance protein-like MFS transporter
MSRKLGLILIYVFVDVLGFSLILPLLPYYAESFNASSTTVGLLLGANALTQFIGAPLIGRLSDRFGRRPLLLASIAGTVVSFLMLGFAQSLWVLFASRIVDGFLGGNISLAQAYITDITDEENRARGLGLIGAVFGIGFIFGPALGGTLSVGGNYSLPAFAAAGLSALNLLGVLLWLPESLPRETRAKRVHSPATEVTARALFDALRRPCVGPLLTVLLFYGLAFTVFTTIFSTFTQRRLGLDARATSYIFTYVGIVIAAVQGGGIGLLTKRFRDKQLVFAGTIVLALALAAWALTPSLAVLLALILPLSGSGGLIGVVSNSALTKSVLPEEVGGTLGLAAALGSLARVVSPVLGGFLMDAAGAWAPGAAAAAIMAGVALFTWRRVLFVPDVCPAWEAAT